jgi:hypothetical protein
VTDVPGSGGLRGVLLVVGQAEADGEGEQGEGGEQAGGGGGGEHPHVRGMNVNSVVVQTQCYTEKDVFTTGVVVAPDTCAGTAPRRAPVPLQTPLIIPDSTPPRSPMWTPAIPGV